MRVASNRDWLNKASVKSLIQIIDAGNNQSRFVGGCVRDSILCLLYTSPSPRDS